LTIGGAGAEDRSGGKVGGKVPGTVRPRLDADTGQAYDVSSGVMTER
jgi:hypothetical protein